jgi:hypothetical protein
MKLLTHLNYYEIFEGAIQMIRGFLGVGPEVIKVSSELFSFLNFDFYPFTTKNVMVENKNRL